MTDIGRKDELLNDLFDSVTHLVHYMNGMLEDMKNNTYDISQADADMEVFETTGIHGVLMELSEIADAQEAITQEIPAVVDVWTHYGKTE